MEEQRYYIQIGLEDIKNKIFPVNWTGDCEEIYVEDPCCPTGVTYVNCETGTTYVYSSMTQLLSGGTNGDSTLTGLTIPIMLTQTTYDMGWYSVFDGLIYQKETLNNFIFSSDTINPYTFYVFNTSNNVTQSAFEIDWGDGSPIVPINIFSPSSLNHTYPASNGTYTIKIKGTTPWGITEVTKTINVPYQNIVPINPNGTVVFYQQGGNWANIPVSYDFLFTGDSNPNIIDYISSSYVGVPFLVTGTTNSTLADLEQYGPVPYPLGIQVTGETGVVGVYYGSVPNGSYSAYTINGVDYWDLSGGTTLYFVQSSGLTQNDLVLSAMTKEEALIGVAYEPEIRSDLFIERGKNSALESIERLGEVDNIGDLVKYGYGFFNVET
jgi:hypothetical protein